MLTKMRDGKGNVSKYFMNSNKKEFVYFICKPLTLMKNANTINS